MSLKEFTYTDSFEVTDQMKNDFDEAGYIIVRDLLDQDELLKVKDALESTDALMKHSFQPYKIFVQGKKMAKEIRLILKINDSEGRKSRLCLWSHPGKDVTGMVGRCEKVAGTSEKLLGGEVYHYHTKLMMKEPYTGGEHVWHQDYGYWYKNGCLFPDMLTVFIAIDKCWKENGCLQILEGSHKCGRIDHVMVGGQTGADLERVEELKKVLPLKFVELNPGDALFFHSNLLHNSAPNQSPHRRWAFLCAYNRASNNPVYEHHHPQYTPLDKVPNSAIKECTNITDMSDKDFMDPSKDKTIIPTKNEK